MSAILPLHHAASCGDLNTVQVLVRNRSALGIRDEDGLTPIIHTVFNNHQQVTSYLVDEMTGEELAVQDLFGYNVLHYMAREGRPWKNIMRSICEKCPDAIQQVNYKGRRPMDVAREKLDDDPNQSRYREVIQHFDRLAQYQVKKGITEKLVQTCNVTVTFIGNVKSGKTCLRKQLSREEFPIDGPGSTNLVEFLANYLDWDPNTGFRQKLGEGGEMETGKERLRRIFKRYSAQQTTDKPDNRNTSAGTASTDDTTAIERICISPTSDLDLSEAQQQFVGEILYQYDDDEYWYYAENEDEVVEDAEETENKDEHESRELDNHEEMKTNDDDTVKGFITLYDFGGETIFYNSHHCFMSGDMVFILVFDVAMCVDSEKGEKEIEGIESWLSSVGTYAVDDKADQNRTPPIILTGSHLDQVSGTEEEKLEVFGSILDKLYQNCRIRQIMENHVQEMFPISNLNDSSQQKDLYEKIWRKIFDVAPLQSEWMKLVPARWIAMEQELLKRKGEGVHVLTYQELKELNRTLLVPLPDEEDVRYFLKKLQMTGSMIVVTLNHNPMIILNPNFILDALKCIITDPKFTSGFRERQRWVAFAKSGKLPFRDLHAIWNNGMSQCFSKNEEITKLAMETLGLLAKPISDDISVDYYIVPCMLLESVPELLQQMLAEPDIVKSPVLCFKFEKEFIPYAIWDKLVATCIHRFHCIEEPGHDQTIFVRRRFVCLAVDYLWNMILNCNGNTMKVTMYKRDRNQSMVQGSGIQIRNILDFLLRNILEMNRQAHLKYYFCLHNDLRFTNNDKMVKVEDILIGSSLPCYGLGGRGWISIDDYSFWFLNTGTRRKRQPHIADSLMESLPDRIPSMKETGRIAKLISGKGYQMFFTELHLPIHILEQIMEETRNASFRTRATKMLLHVWNTQHGIGFAEIMDAMQKHNMPYTALMTILDSNRVDECKGLDLPAEVLHRPISTLFQDVVADYIGAKSYFNLFIELGMDYKAIDIIDVNHGKVGDRIQALLAKWIQDDGEEATVKKLMLAMTECDMDVKSLSDYILAPR
ncbi:uncharacterized protein LOC110457875 isoform X2 [Mizuhopecten yessoensis]|uniref:uncharacterized protein LOC110457875 isoform X2 n=1 Tax=Mizuhopecten yessoensis TaxID=6573 RepID=UPI000B45A098|nr:uncharacterized protein LOC110457875 isoform X2 [Mizuhopecten yessoensis]